MFFVFGVCAVADSLARIEIPIFADDVLLPGLPGFSSTNEDGGTAWIPTYGVRCAAGNSIANQPAMYSSQISKVLPAKQDERIEDRAPG